MATAVRWVVRGGGDGFTLLEVLVAIIVLSVAMLGMASLTGSIVRSSELACQISSATTLAQDKIEALKNTAYSTLSGSVESGLDSDGSTGGIFGRVTTVSNGEAYSNTKTITVTVGWNWMSTPQSVVVKTIVGQ